MMPYSEIVWEKELFIKMEQRLILYAHAQIMELYEM